jgi:hypothetical protein
MKTMFEKRVSARKKILHLYVCKNNVATKGYSPKSQQEPPPILEEGQYSLKLKTSALRAGRRRGQRGISYSKGT